MSKLGPAVYDDRRLVLYYETDAKGVLSTIYASVKCPGRDLIDIMLPPAAMAQIEDLIERTPEGPARATGLAVLFNLSVF